MGTVHDLKQEKKAHREMHKNKDLIVYKNGKIELKADGIGSNEILTAMPITKGLDNDNRCKVCFKLNGCDLYLSAAKNGKLSVKQWVRDWEKWVVEKDEKTGMFSFKSHHGNYLCAEKGKVPKADRKKKGDWEKWRIVVVQNANSKQEMVQNEGSYY